MFPCVSGCFRVFPIIRALTSHDEKAPPDTSGGAPGGMPRELVRRLYYAMTRSRTRHPSASPFPPMTRSQPSESMQSKPCWHKSPRDLLDRPLYPISAATSVHVLAST